ncbi:MAG TPA: hypothetical protein PK970_02895 [Hyphomicrobiaceae bacterium]|nr:hypothetical protein [Hyphomicrobiaceae bacterium]
MTDGERRLIERDPEHQARHDAAMREGYVARRYRAAYFGVAMFGVVVLLWILRIVGVI